MSQHLIECDAIGRIAVQQLFTTQHTTNTPTHHTNVNSSELPTRPTSSRGQGRAGQGSTYSVDEVFGFV
jgi:hypothetical protein